MIEDPTPTEYKAVLRQDFVTFAARGFRYLNPQAELGLNWHIEVIAAKLAAVRRGETRRVIITLPPRHLKSHCWIVNDNNISAAPGQHTAGRLVNTKN